MDILNSIVINYYLIYICLIYCQINANGISIGPSKTLTNSYVANKLRLARYGDANKCGKRKRNIENRRCFRQCSSDSDCRGVKKRCLCDGECGLSCVRINQSCNKIEDFPNGRTFYNPDNLFGGHLIYECDPGFKLMGNRIRVCEGDGWWSGSSPVCIKEVFCDQPPVILNAMPNIQVINGSRYRMGTEIEYQCDIGYNSNYDLNKSVCQNDGTWSDITFKCIKITCGQPDGIENGVIRASDYSYSSVIEYRCNLGYYLTNGDYLRECLITGEWSGKQPICEPVNCGEPPLVENAIMNYNSTVFGSKVIYKCIDKRFVQDGSIDNLECLFNGKWSTDYIPKCLRVNCTLNPTQLPVYGYIKNATEFQLDYNVYPVGTVIEIECDRNYELIGDQTLLCRLNGQWSNSMPNCKLDVYCPALYAPENGLLEPSKLNTPKGYPVDTILNFKCSHDFQLSGSSSRKCDQKGKWTGENPSCIKQATLPIKDLIAPSNVKYLEPTGCYLNLGDDNTSIIASNQILIVKHPLNSYIENGTIINYACKVDIADDYVAICINGELVFDVKCEPKVKVCQTPQKISNGYLKLGSYLNGSKAVYKCFSGFELRDGDKELVCVNGNWTGLVPSCIKVNCGYPGTLQNGKILYVGSLLIHGSLSEYTYKPYMTSMGQNKQIKYVCDNGYTLIGSPGSTCINGNWKPSLNTAKCVKDKLFDKNYNLNQITDISNNFDSLINSNSINSALEPIVGVNNPSLLTTVKINQAIKLKKNNPDEYSNESNQQSRLVGSLRRNFIENPNEITTKIKNKKSNNKLKRLKKHKMRKSSGKNEIANNSTQMVQNDLSDVNKNRLKNKKKKNINKETSN